MARRELATDASVAHLLKVEKARGTRRLVRLEDLVDWELLSDTLDALLYDSPPPRWAEGEVPLLVQLFLARTRPHPEAYALTSALTARPLGLAGMLRPADAAELTDLGLTEAEVRHLRGLLGLIFAQYGGLNLEPIRRLSVPRAVEALAAIPGVTWPEAEAILLLAWGREILPSLEPVLRVTSRMGALPTGIPAEKAGTYLRLPTGLPARPLFDRLLLFADAICQTNEPQCSACSLRKLCDYGRRPLRREPRPGELTFVDLFAGVGGVSHGLGQAGFQPVLAVEWNTWAARAYLINHPELSADRVVCGDIQELEPEEFLANLPAQVDLVIGGPPCQGFSLIGKRSRSATKFQDDPRNHLYKEFLRWVAVVSPRFVVMENVPGLYSYQEGRIRSEIQGNLQELGFVVNSLVVDSSNFGVPQRRQRVLFVGVSQRAFGGRAEEMVDQIIQILGSTVLPPVTLREAIGDLPPLDSGDGREAVRLRPKSPSAYRTEMRANWGSVLFHHVARPINTRDTMLYARLKPGETSEGAQEKDLRRVMAYRDDAFGDKYRRLTYDEPGPTVMSHLAKDGHMYIHPDRTQLRSITVREAARIQSFPDDFLFWGPRTHQFTQVGNAVPPLLARAVGEAIRQTLLEV